MQLGELVFQSVIKQRLTKSWNFKDCWLESLKVNLTLVKHFGNILLVRTVEIEIGVMFMLTHLNIR